MDSRGSLLDRPRPDVDALRPATFGHDPDFAQVMRTLESQSELMREQLRSSEASERRSFVLMWLASVADEDGNPPSRALAERNGSFSPESRADLAARYRALERAGYVDCLGFAWGNDVISVRLTEEGRDAAETIIDEELESPAISDETKSSIRGALISQGINIAASLLLRLVSLG